MVLIEMSDGGATAEAVWDRMMDAGYRCYWPTRSPRTPYPRRSYLPIETIDEFLIRNRDESREFVTEHDFIFVQPRTDCFAEA